MYNHARTLLVNLPGSSGYLENYPGEELIPAEYASIELPTYLNVVRMRLFGATPDRCMLNYRSAQLLQLISSTELQGHVLALDPRLTYDQPLGLDNPEIFNPKLTRYLGSGQLRLLGNPIAPDVSGQASYAYQITVTGDNVTVKRQTFPTATTSETLVITNGLSQEINLPYLGYWFTLDNNAEAGWTVRGFLRPQLALTEIEQSLKSIGEPYLLQLFGTKAVEPYLTFRNCWTSHSDFAYRLGGIVLALIYRTEELRNG